MRLCAVCHTKVDVQGICNFTAHEFNCYKKAGPGSIPYEHKAHFENTLRWEKRSAAAKRGAATRRLHRKAAKEAATNGM